MHIGEFNRPIGAAADVKELEYISALHQTDLRELRVDCSIKDVDIVHFLSSRYGIRVTCEEVRTTILNGLGGGNDDDDCIDLMEMVAILLIPTLITASRESSSCSSAEEDGEKGEEDGDTETKSEDCESNWEKKRRMSAAAKLKRLTPPPGLLQFVLDMILHDVTGSRKPKKLDRELIRQIFISYGETQLAQDDELLGEMLKAAGSGNDTDGSEDLVLDKDTFARALTGDVLLYDVENVLRLTTNYHDVFKINLSTDDVDTKPPRKDIKDDEEQEGDIMNERSIRLARTEMRPIHKVFTAPSIDFIAGTYRSKVLVVGLWTSFLVSYFAYYYGTGEFGEGECEPFRYNAGWAGNGEAFGCRVIIGIIRWLFIFAVVSLYGLIYIGVGSIGNEIECRKKRRPLIGITVVSLFTYLPFSIGRVSNSGDYMYLYIASLLLGSLVVVIYVLQCISLIFSNTVQKHPRLERFLTPGGIFSEAYVKEATAHKIGVMISNALDVARIKDSDNIMTTHFGQSLLAFSKVGKKFELAGGFRWTWSRIFSRDLFRMDGVWLSGRLLASNFTQFIVSIFVLISGINFFQHAMSDYDEKQVHSAVDEVISSLFEESITDELINSIAANVSSLVGEFFALSLVDADQNCSSLFIPAQEGNADNNASVICDAIDDVLLCRPTETSYLCTLAEYGGDSSIDQMQLLNSSGFDVAAVKTAARIALNAYSDEAVDNLYPEERYMISVPLIIGICVAFLTAVSLAVTYIPSVTSTTLQLRSGVIPTLRNRNFGRYRIAVDQITVITGSMFWGCLVSSLLCGGLVGGIVFVFVWQGTTYFVVRFLAFLIGITITILIKISLVVLCRISFYKAFYRMKPASANIAALALECSNFALSVGFVFLRMVKLLFMSALYVGRIDTPFLAPQVGVFGCIEMDMYPSIFLKEILAHEAHRHPYLELMGVMYMMKLRYGENFGKTAGSCWRLIFVFALMPWLNRYRILARREMKDIEEEEKQFNAFTLRDVAFVSLRNKFEREVSSKENIGLDNLVLGSGSQIDHYSACDDAKLTNVLSKDSSHQDVEGIDEERRKESVTLASSLEGGIEFDAELSSTTKLPIEERCSDGLIRSEQGLADTDTMLSNLQRENAELTRHSQVLKMKCMSQCSFD